MSPLRIVVVGGGFAGVWSALGAARLLTEQPATVARTEICLVSADRHLVIRPRLYESNLNDVRVPLERVLDPVGVKFVEAFVTGVDAIEQAITADVGGHEIVIRYDRLVLAAGSHVHRPPLPGLDEHAYTVDTFAEAQRLQDHLRSPERGQLHATPYSAAVIGAGFTGLEVVTELVGRLGYLARRSPTRSPVQVTLIEGAPELGPDLGPGPRPVIKKALRDLGVDVRLGDPAVAITQHGVRLSSGRWVGAATVVWTGGLRANPLAASFGMTTDPLGRLDVDEALRVRGVNNVFASGDIARAMADRDHSTLMSCQHAIPMGKVAGHNVAAALTGRPLRGYEQPEYVTCLDLGQAGAVFTTGWERTVAMTGPEAKLLKAQINRRHIYPPSSADRQELLNAARFTTGPMLA